MTPNGPAIKGVCVAELMEAGAIFVIEYGPSYQPE
jgi:hypothetical protein